MESFRSAASQHSEIVLLSVYPERKIQSTLL